MISRQIGSRCWVTFLMWSVIWWLIRAFFHSFEDVRCVNFILFNHHKNSCWIYDNFINISRAQRCYNISKFIDHKALHGILFGAILCTISFTSRNFSSHNWQECTDIRSSRIQLKHNVDILHAQKFHSMTHREDCVRKKVVYRVICVEI